MIGRGYCCRICNGPHAAKASNDRNDYIRNSRLRVQNAIKEIKNIHYETLFLQSAEGFPYGQVKMRKDVDAFLDWDPIEIVKLGLSRVYSQALNDFVEGLDNFSNSLENKSLIDKSNYLGAINPPAKSLKSWFDQHSPNWLENITAANGNVAIIDPGIVAFIANIEENSDR